MSQSAAKELKSAWAEHPDYRIDFEPSARRVRVELGGETIADSINMRLMLETKHLPVYYFPRADVRMDRLERSAHQTFCPFKGAATHYAPPGAAEPVAWSYEAPFDEVAEIEDYLAFYWDRVERWLEEDEEIFVHARDPYKRIDTIPSSREVKVVVGGETVATSSHAHFLFETGLPTRYYMPREDVRLDLLRPSDKRSRCPYKGEAVYWSLEVGGKLHEDLVWSYPSPIPETPKIKDLLCFFNEAVDEITVDGEVIPKVKTPWSRD